MSYRSWLTFSLLADNRTPSTSGRSHQPRLPVGSPARLNRFRVQRDADARPLARLPRRHGVPARPCETVYARWPRESADRTQGGEPDASAAPSGCLGRWLWAVGCGLRSRPAPTNSPTSRPSRPMPNSEAGPARTTDTAASPRPSSAIWSGLTSNPPSNRARRQPRRPVNRTPQPRGQEKNRRRRDLPQPRRAASVVELRAHRGPRRVARQQPPLPEQGVHGATQPTSPDHPGTPTR